MNASDNLSRFHDLVANVLSMRQQWFRQLLDPRRDVDDECGYPRSASPITVEQYQLLYEREPVAARVVQVFPRESWQVQPTVYESEEGDTTTEFEKVWNELGSQIASGGRARGLESYFKEESGSLIWDYLRRADELSGIGQFGVILIGLDDGTPLAQPARMGQRDRKILFLRVFPESLIQISRFDANPASPRFGQPEMYLLTLNDPRQMQSGIGLSMATVEVHWSRVIHIADNLGSSEVFGVPRMRPVFNRLMDLRKLHSGSAEMYWRGAFPGYSLETHPTLGGDVDVDREGLKDMMEDYMNGLQRYLSLMGMSAKSLAPQVVDPSPQILVQLEAICIQLGVPKRVFMGSERGELASSQDDQAWNDRLRQRQRDYITPRIIVPFVDRLIALGVLPTPKSYCVWWPDLTSQSDKEKAHVSFQRTQAIAQYITSGAEVLMTPFDYFTRVMHFTDDEAKSIIEHAQAAMESEYESDEITEWTVPPEVPTGEPTAPPTQPIAPGQPNKSPNAPSSATGAHTKGQYVDSPSPKEKESPRDRPRTDKNGTPISK